jgi:hypothetical protein
LCRKVYRVFAGILKNQIGNQKVGVRIPSAARSSEVLSVIVCRRHIWNLDHASQTVGSGSPFLTGTIGDIESAAME